MICWTAFYHLELSFGRPGRFRVAINRVGHLGNEKVLARRVVRLPLAQVGGNPVRQFVLALEESIGNIFVAGLTGVVDGRLSGRVQAARIRAVNEEELHLRGLSGSGRYMERARPFFFVEVVGIGSARQEPQRRLQVGRPDGRVELF